GAGADHRIVLAGHARYVEKLPGVPRVGDIDDRRAIRLHLTRQRIEERPLMMAHVKDEAVALLDYGRLVGWPALEIGVADPPHVLRIGTFAVPAIVGPCPRCQRDN